MTTILQNFVVVRQRRGDVLNPTEYRSIIEMIRGILGRYNFDDLNSGYGALLAHIVDYHNPHHDDSSNLFEVIVEKIYAIYVNMTQYPLSLVDFKTTIVPTMSFFELTRRIILNRYLYDLVKLPNGSVPTTATIYLTSDWLGSGKSGTVTLNFPGHVATETDFVKLGWNGNTTPTAVIANANVLASPTAKLPLIYETSSDVVYQMIDSTGAGFAVPLLIASNDVTIRIVTVGDALTNATVLTLRNSTDTLKIIQNTDHTVSLQLNNGSLLQTPVPTSDGKIEVIINSQGYITLTTNQNGQAIAQTSNFSFISSAPFTSGVIGIAYEDLITPGYGLRSLAVYRGYSNSVPQIPVGYVVLTDYDGSYLLDYDGSFIIDAA